MPAPRVKLDDVSWPEGVILSHVVTRPAEDGWEFEGYFLYRKPARVPRRPRCEVFSVRHRMSDAMAESAVDAAGMLAAAFRRGMHEHLARIAGEDARSMLGDARVVPGRELPVVEAA